MCGPERGQNTPEGIVDEAAVLEGRNGLKERRVNGPSKQRVAGVSVGALVGLIAGIIVAPFFVNVRGVSTLEERTKQMQVTLERIEADFSTLAAQVQLNTNELAIGGRYTLEEELQYRERESEAYAKIRERLAIIEYELAQD
jgi:gas vesicle protein